MDETGGTIPRTHQLGAGAVGETEHVLGLLRALLTACERLRAMSEAAAGRLCRMLRELEARCPPDEGRSLTCVQHRSAGEPTRKAPGLPPPPPRPNGTPSVSLRGVRLEKSVAKGPWFAVKRELLSAPAIVVAALWALGFITESPEPPVSAPLSPTKALESRELGRGTSDRDPMAQGNLPSQEGPADATARAMRRENRSTVTSAVGTGEAPRQQVLATEALKPDRQGELGRRISIIRKEAPAYGGTPIAAAGSARGEVAPRPLLMLRSDEAARLGPQARVDDAGRVRDLEPVGASPRLTAAGDDAPQRERGSQAP